MAVVITYKHAFIPADVLIDVGYRYPIIHEEGNKLILDGDEIDDVKSFVGEEWNVELDLDI